MVIYRLLIFQGGIAAVITIDGGYMNNAVATACARYVAPIFRFFFQNAKRTRDMNYAATESCSHVIPAPPVVVERSSTDGRTRDALTGTL